MRQKLTDAIGWYGTAAILGAYALNSFGILGSHTIWYQTLNITGSLGIVIISFAKKVYQPVVLNIIWALIGLIGLIQVLFR